VSSSDGGDTGSTTRSSSASIWYSPEAFASLSIPQMRLSSQSCGAQISDEIELCSILKARRALNAGCDRTIYQDVIWVTVISVVGCIR